MNMFKSLCAKLYSPMNKFDRWFLDAAMVTILSALALGLTSLIWFTINAVFMGRGISLIPFVLILGIIIFASIGPPILYLIGWSIGQWGKYATNGKVSLFDNFYNSINEYILKTGKYDSTTKPALQYAICLTTSVIIVSVGVLSVMLFYFTALAITICVLTGLTMLSRKSFQVGDKVASHIQDPNAHKKGGVADV